MILNEITKKDGFTSLQYVSEEMIADYDVIREDDVVLLKKEEHFHWYSNKPEDLLIALKAFKAVRLSFIPMEWVQLFKLSGFEIEADFREFIATDLKGKEKIVYLNDGDCQLASVISKACQNLSRGYEGNTSEWYEEWLAMTNSGLVNASASKSDVLAYYDEELKGVVAVALYNKTLWIRDLAVHPEFHNQKIGTRLMAMTMSYGVEHGAKKAFLMADANNTAGIRLYENYGFKATDDYEISMYKDSVSYLEGYLNKTVEVMIDRKKGSKHPQFDMIYPINYGYLANTISADEMPIDAYILDEENPISAYHGHVIGIVHRLDDLEDKLLVSNRKYSKDEIATKVLFTEQYFKSEIILSGHELSTDRWVINN